MKEQTSVSLRAGLAFCVIVVLLAISRPAMATTVLRVGIDEMLEGSALVFEGEVLGRQADRDHANGWIRTFITFAVHDVIKGKYVKPTVTLEFLGGTVGENTFKVHGTVMPKDGERGIYFVESLTRTQINPLYGWTQGHLLLVDDPQGTQRVQTRHHRPVVSVEFEPSDPVLRSLAILSAKRGNGPFSDGEATGLSTASIGSPVPGMAKRDFVSRLKARVAATQP